MKGIVVAILTNPFFSAVHSGVLVLGYVLKYLWSDLSLPSASDILQYILSCRASAICGLPIYLQKSFATSE